MDDIILYKILAILGALAWLPPIISYLHKFFTKPKVSIISDKQIEIGYTTYGPIINLRLAFDSTKKDALIDLMTITLIHENHKTHQFTWEWFEEQLMEIQGPKGEIIPYKKNQQAIAIKVLTNNLVEKKIGFQSDKIKEEANKYVNELNKINEYYLNQKKDLTDLKTTKEYNILYDAVKNSFIWEKGNYQINIKTSIQDPKLSFNHKIKFYLSDMDIKKLEKNINSIQKNIENYYIVKDDNFKIHFEWVYPSKIDN